MARALEGCEDEQRPLLHAFAGGTALERNRRYETVQALDRQSPDEDKRRNKICW